MSNATEKMTSKPNRITVVDALRGFALLGILLINITAFYAPGGPPGLAMTGDFGDRLVVYALIMLVESKFFTLFSFLFGLGFSIQLRRAQSDDRTSESDNNFRTKFTRRLLALGVFGILHIVFLWDGDILLIYALVGFLLLPVRRCESKTLLKSAAFLLLVPLIINSLGAAAITGARFSPQYGEQINRADCEISEQFSKSRTEAVEKLSGGTYSELLTERVTNYQSSFFLLLTRVPTILAMFLLGLWAGKTQVLENPEKHLKLLRRLRLWGLIVGFPISLAVVAVYANLPPVAALAVLFFDQTLAGPILCFGYAAAFVLAARRKFWGKLFAPLNAVGRMSLTNYLTQSLVCTVLFSGYGFRLAGKVTPLGGIGLTFVIFAAQVLFSRFWLKFFRYGPAEWLWRSFTFLQWQSFLKQ